MSAFSMRRVLLTILYPLIKWAGKVHLPFTHKGCTSKDVRRIQELCDVGQILLSRTRGELTTLLIPGHWKHAAIVIDAENVIEAVGGGVRKSDLIDFVMTKDEVCLIAPLFLFDHELAKSRAESAIGKPYDYFFTPGLDAFYCAELPAWCLNNPAFRKKTTLGVETIEPQDYYEAKDKFEVLFES